MYKENVIPSNQRTVLKTYAYFKPSSFKTKKIPYLDNNFLPLNV